LKKVDQGFYRWCGIFICVGGVGLIWWAIGFSQGGLRKHDFTGQCQICHTAIPAEGAAFEDTQLVEPIDQACFKCHAVDSSMSHPIGVSPNKRIPLQRYLGEGNQLTCLTCHNVHKENNSALSQRELKGLLRGHAQGRAFCATCHEDRYLGADWGHNLSVTYAHMSDQLIQSKVGAQLDKFSVECLSCHDGVISTSGGGEVRSGEFRHGIGLSHPIGVKYPSMSAKNDFVPVSMLPEEAKLFDGNMGCLTCHNPYGGRKSLLIMENRRSALCFACHRK